MAEKPKYRVYCKSKASSNYQDLLAFWDNEKGISGTLDREVDKIILKNGQVITGDAVWFNMKITDEQNQEPPKVEQAVEQNQAYGGVDESDIPF